MRLNRVTRHLTPSLIALTTGALLVSSGPVFAQQKTDPPQTSKSSTSSQTTASGASSASSASPQKPATAPGTTIDQTQLDRIKTALKTDPPLTKLNDDDLRFYLEIVARQPTFKDFVGSTDLKSGPVKGQPMTHQEFLNMVTPKLLYSQAGFSASEMLQAGLVNVAAQRVAKAFEDLKKAHSDAEVQAIRDRIDRELTALKGGGGQ
jgi:hypothetical protein